MAEIIPKLKSARVDPAGIRKNKKAKTMTLSINFPRMKVLLEGIEIKPSVDDPL